MKDLQYWQQKIQDKRKQTDFRNFLIEVVSWSPLTYYRNNGYISIFPVSGRIGNIVSLEKFEEKRNDMCDTNLQNSESIFEELITLIQKTLLPSVRNYFQCENSEFSDTNSYSKDLYLTRCSTKSSKLLNCLVVKDTGDVYHFVKVQGGEGSIYCSVSVDESYNVFYSRVISNSSDIWFSSGLTGCNECLFCSEMENSSYCISNIQYSKEEYMREKKLLLAQKERFGEWFSELKGLKFVNESSENIQNCYGATSVKNGNNGIILGNPLGTENMYDVIMCGTSQDYYGVSDSGALSEQVYCSCSIVKCHSIFYSFFLESCSFCFGCVGLKNKSFCILNKQYSKDEWYEEIDKIFEGMQQDGSLGEFLPPKMNPFYFNDTIAGLIGGFSKQEVIDKGYLWRDEKVQVDIPEGSEVISTVDLKNYQGYDPQGNWYINPDILKKVIQDREGNYYRIIEMEYDFLVKYELPLPALHWLNIMKLHFN